MGRVANDWSSIIAASSFFLPKEMWDLLAIHVHEAEVNTKTMIWDLQINSSSYLRSAAWKIVVVLVVGFEVVHTLLNVVSQFAERSSVPTKQLVDMETSDITFCGGMFGKYKACPEKGDVLSYLIVMMRFSLFRVSPRIPPIQTHSLSTITNMRSSLTSSKDIRRSYLLDVPCRRGILELKLCEMFNQLLCK